MQKKMRTSHFGYSERNDTGVKISIRAEVEGKQREINSISEVGRRVDRVGEGTPNGRHW